jgi:hypothetical protein
MPQCVIAGLDPAIQSSGWDFLDLRVKPGDDIGEVEAASR